MISLTLPVPPSVNRYWKTTRTGKVYSSPEAVAYKSRVKLLTLKALGPNRRIEGPVKVSFSVYRPRKSGDLDNYAKVLFDAMNGVTWRDDSQVTALHAWRYDDKTNPRVEVVVEPA